MHLWHYVTTLFPANVERSSLETSVHLYCDVTSLCKFGALKSYLFLVLSRVPLSTSFIDLFGKLYIWNWKFWLCYKRWNLRLNSTLGDWKIICNSRKFAINEFALNVEKMYRLCTFLAGELEKLRNKGKFAISVFVISEFYCSNNWYAIFQPVEPYTRNAMDYI